MGQEIASSRFTPQDYTRFAEQLKAETEYLRCAVKENRCGYQAPGRLGIELEGCLVDRQGAPLPKNNEFLHHADHPFLETELAKFNFELHSSPLQDDPNLLHRLHDELNDIWHHATIGAKALHGDAVTIGILPSLERSMLSKDAISDAKRYYALNREILALRNQQPLTIDIKGKETLHMQHDDIMLEAATTSLQIHVDAPLEGAVELYNNAMIFSAAMVGITGNAPFLFGSSLWHETRIPLFEQAVSVTGKGCDLPRVSFGSGYVQDIMELFDENLQHYPVLLPARLGSNTKQLRHVRLHNGTIWRWNRPIITVNKAGQICFRIEHRPCASGPTLVDAVANAAFFLGLVEFYRSQRYRLQDDTPFEQIKHNFYHAAKEGINAMVSWRDQKPIKLKTLARTILLPAAMTGLRQLGIAPKDINYYLGDVMRKRVTLGQTGSLWQQRFCAKHGNDMGLLTRNYVARMQEGKPVATWDIEKQAA